MLMASCKMKRHAVGCFEVYTAFSELHLSHVVVREQPGFID
jgi:hypothetical protein